MHPARRWMVFLSAAIAAVLAVALPAVNASAATRSAAGNRVGASHSQTISTVGVSHPVLPGQGRCGGLPQAQVAAGACVAAEDAGSGAAQTVFRADTRGPEEIFSRGFEPKGGNMNLWEHVTQNPADSGFVSTTKSLSSAQDFAAEIRADYIYRLRATGTDVNATFGADSPFPWENEIAVPGSIPGSSIEGAWGPGGWTGNPFFAP